MKNQKGALGVEGYLKSQKKLQSYLEGQRVHSSILVVGPQEESRFEIAKKMALWILAKKKGINPQEESTLSRRIEKGLHPDVFLYQEPEETSIKIEVIRELCTQMEYSPLEGGAKVCIVDDCQRLTESAANAILKSLEEPGPDRYYLLLTAQPSSLLPTLISRCVSFQLWPDSHTEITDSAAAEFDSALTEFQKTRNTMAVQSLLKEKESAHQFLLHLQTRSYREMRNFSAADDDALYGSLRAFEACLETEAQLRSNANYGLMLENLLIQHFGGERHL